jgi:hypothetical protein
VVPSLRLSTRPPSGEVQMTLDITTGANAGSNATGAGPRDAS